MKFFFRYRFVLGLAVGLLWLGLVVSVVTANHSYVQIAPLSVPSMAYAASHSSQQNSAEPSFYSLPAVLILGQVYKNINGTEYYGPMNMDINGDGLPDLVYSFSELGSNAWKQYVALGNGSGYDVVYSCDFNGSRFYGDCAGSGAARTDTSRRYAALENPLHLSGSGAPLKPGNVAYALPEGQIHGLTLSRHGHHNDTRSPVFSDVNGDGLPDMMYSSRNLTGTLYQFVALNTGDGFEEVYRCIRGGSLYYGDCAASSS
jgi:hypothetical protein